MLCLHFHRSYDAKCGTASLWHKRAVKVRITFVQSDADSRCSSIYAYAFRDYVSRQ